VRNTLALVTKGIGIIMLRIGIEKVFGKASLLLSPTYTPSGRSSALVPITGFLPTVASTNITTLWIKKRLSRA
jgi:hypothetical protein